MTLQLRFEQGSLVFDNVAALSLDGLPGVVYDSRTLEFRAKASDYRAIVLEIRKRGIEFNDLARDYTPLDCTLVKSLVPREHQAKALTAWEEQGGLGLVSLPTGAGKTILAVLAIAAKNRSSLVIVPTIDLLHQWQGVLSEFFGQSVGALGGGEKTVKPLTVATYESARIHIERIGNRFGFLIFDECHHLPAPFYRGIALSSLAPFRLGLSATIARSDGREEDLNELIGRKVYETDIRDMAGGGVLAPYEVIQIEVELSVEERLAYDQSRKTYIDFVRSNGINFSQPDAWSQFIMRASRSAIGRKALHAYRMQRKLAQAASGKLSKTWDILSRHANEATIIFTDNNELAYQIGQTFMLAVLTHKTKAKERKKFLELFRQGTLKVLVTSKVLNEGVDVPEARVGIVVSGSGAVREHVQRLGRILRHRPGKQAVLYEIVSKDTSEQSVNSRRRQHSAYERSH